MTPAFEEAQPTYCHRTWSVGLSFLFLYGGSPIWLVRPSPSLNLSQRCFECRFKRRFMVETSVSSCGYPALRNFESSRCCNVLIEVAREQWVWESCTMFLLGSEIQSIITLGEDIVLDMFPWLNVFERWRRWILNNEYIRFATQLEPQKCILRCEFGRMVWSFQVWLLT